ncbi:MAG: hypothetical protein ABR529_13000 [Actinomycetota bacterium]
MGENEDVSRLSRQVREDRKLLRRAADVLAEIDRGAGLSDEHADVLASLRIRLEGRSRSSLEDLLTAAGEVRGKRDLGDVISGGDESKSEWPAVQDKKKEWPGL